MARQLVNDMSSEWDPDEFRDSFKDEILRLVEHKAAAGQTEAVTQPEQGATTETESAKIIDLTELLRRSLRGKRAAGAKNGTGSAASHADADTSNSACDAACGAPKAARQTSARKRPATQSPATSATPARRRAV